MEPQELRHKVMVVDDEDSFRLVCCEILKATGRYETEGYATGEEAIAALQIRSYDAVVLDYVLPGASGLNVLQWMHEEKMDTPVILMTGAGSETVAVEAMKFGAYDYIPKHQFDKDHLPIVVQSVIERRAFKMEREMRQSLERDREKVQLTMKTMVDAVASLQQTVGNTLALISTTLDERQQDIEAIVPLERRSFVTQVCADLRHQFEVLSLASKALVNLSTFAMKRIQSTPGAIEYDADLRKTLEMLRTVSDSLDEEK